jgi:phosphocarrier protein HPr
MPGQTATSSAEATVVIQNKLGLHARPAMSFVDTANAFRADVRVVKGAQEVDGKSIMQMMMLAATQGTNLKIKAQGPDAGEAIEALRQLVDGKFDEE